MVRGYFLGRFSHDLNEHIGLVAQEVGEELGWHGEFSSHLADRV
jgi:hypothetical protein